MPLLLWLLIRDKMPPCFSALQILVPSQVPSSLVLRFQVSVLEEELSLRSMRMVWHLNAEALCSSRPFEAAQRYAS